ncbi:MAG: hypothetical protein JJV98_07005 [Desulfosarcina sp.]|nr:hypothetical protein [Desulfobacterales bacterium]
MKPWRCTVCEHIEKAASPPAKCPVCGSESNLFVPAGGESEPSPVMAETHPALRWQCLVCGYIHTGPEPPDKCPVCGADRSQFICLDREAEDVTPPASADEAKPERQWRCTVCGYIHTGPEPPLKCPVCGADQTMFEAVVDEAEPATPPTSAEPEGDAPPTGKKTALGITTRINQRLDRYRNLIALAIENHAHPISVHIPNGVLPIAVVMVLLAAMFDMPALGLAGFYNMIFILLAMPVVLFTGYLHWQYKFGGHMTPLFKGKIICGSVVSVIALILVIWAMVDRRITAEPSLLYIGLHLVMLAVAAYAGYLGGRLVFHRNS